MARIDWAVHWKDAGLFDTKFYRLAIRPSFEAEIEKYRNEELLKNTQEPE